MVLRPAPLLLLLALLPAWAAAQPALSPEEVDALSGGGEETVAAEEPFESVAAEAVDTPPPSRASRRRAAAVTVDDDEDQRDGSDFDGGGGDSPRLKGPAPAYVIGPGKPEQLALALPTLPDLSRYTPAAVQAKIPRKPAGRARVASMLGEDVFKTFYGGDNRLREWALRQSSLPQAIYIEGGTVTPADLARQLPRQYFERTAANVYVARLPIDVRPNASFHIPAGTQLRLSQDRGAFLVSEGKLFITDAHLLGWNEARKSPSNFRDGKEFRPFLLAWGGSETYIVGSKVSNLGYAASKSYGVSISQFSPALKPKMNRRNPSGWLLNSEFYDNWYGFYCYEADDIVIRGNVYRDNIVYGIDPHDRSLRLIIAENKAHGTKKKHGIIVSREVNDSWIFRNESYENHLSGIVIDRSSVHNVVAENRVYRNRADGITVYESPDTLLWRNVASANERHGIRIRNSTDIQLRGNVAIGNRLSGVYGHIKDLTGTGRNLHVDPFHEKVSMVVVGGQLVSNGSAPVNIDQPLSLELYDVELLAPRREFGIKFTGVLGRYQDQVLDLLVRQRLPVVIHPAGALKPAKVSVRSPLPRAGEGTASR